MASKFYTGTLCGGAFRDILNLSLPLSDVNIDHIIRDVVKDIFKRISDM